jgi:hypothetical protein
VVCGPDSNSSLRQLGAYTDCRPRESSQHMRKIEDLSNAIRGLKAFPSEQIVMATITGPNTPFAIRKGTTSPLEVAPACSYRKPNCAVTATEDCLQKAAPSVRIANFADRFAQNFQTTICKDDLSDSIAKIAAQIVAPLNPRCFNSVLQSPPVCNVTDVLNYQTGNETSKLIPQCNAAKSNLPCWHIETNTADCDTSIFSGEEIKIERSNAEPLPPTAVSKVECESKSKN